ncbi:RNA-binding transcriptional accessory protein [Roseiconus nitratireducens]|uniref:RNA-binding transcriptional accessory protein n=2 Tax=Roseiconus nitratireducens TaxID=2605748 RepID=A0A5M6D6Y0_9BACT|nr:RNA-binding transcriptional accessory protein [Roseiconus nitratireducens]
MVAAIATELGIPPQRIRVAIELLQSGNTVPFIARYRKEATGTLDEIQLRAIEDALERFELLQARKRTVLKSIDGQGLLTDALRQQIQQCGDMASLELIYLPFKPKRRTRAEIARQRGLQPLADQLMAQRSLGQSKTATLQPYVDASGDVPDCQAALEGALDIVAEQWSEDPPTRKWLVDQAFKFGKLTSKVKRGKKDETSADKFEQYFDRTESVKRVPGHRVLAMMRGVSEGVLRVQLHFDGTRELDELTRRLVQNRQFEFASELRACVQDCYQRLLIPATESTILQQLKEQADEEAIEVFGKNLRELLMSPPAGPRVTLGVDPGFRTGCKLAVVDKTGRFLDHATVFPTPPRNDTDAAGRTLIGLIQKHGVELIAIGNGTASRETESFVRTLVRENDLSVTSVMVSESGASIYSASDLAVKEFPNLDLTVRGAISIARRLQDPLAELVKTDPKSIGVGQYQHDVNQPRLRKCLDRVVESCVNTVGVDLNTASAPLLSYVAGIGPKLAERIVNYRDSHGRFASRTDLTSVPTLGKKAFEQAAGFLRIRGGAQPLDDSAVHPECYRVVQHMAQRLGRDVNSLLGNPALTQTLSPEEFVEGEVGLPTVRDILAELAKPGRDPRSEFRAVKFSETVNAFEDVTAGMVLEGQVTNVTHFGAFVDVGVHQDGLVHVSQLADRFVSDPSEIVTVGDVVRVKVLEVDAARKRISLTLKF